MNRTQMEEFKPAEYINPKDFSMDLLPSWRCILTDIDQVNDNVGFHLEQVIRNFVWLPDELLYQVVCSYMMLSQKWCKVVPIMFSYGLPGSGKSTVSLLTAYLHNQEYTFSSSDTFPSIRNSLDLLRWIDEDKQYEKDGAILCWDNLGTDTLRRDPRLYQLLLFGYNRNTDKVMIANTDGTNKVFHVFCPKIISSVEPLHLDSEFQELQRRFLVIHHKKCDGIPNVSIESLNDYDFTDFPTLFFNFWHEKLNCLKYVSTRKSVSQAKWSIPETQKTISIDLAATHSLIYGCSPKESINLLEQYWMGLATKTTKSVFEEFLEEFMSAEFRKLAEMNVTYIRHSAIRDFINTLVKDGAIDIKEAKEHIKVLQKMGYQKTKFGWKKI
jgi:hypothetical protein